MATSKHQHKKPLFALLGLLCPAFALPVSILTSRALGPQEDYLGYGALGIALMTILIILLAGVLSSVIAFIRKERPVILPVSTLVICALGLTWVLVNKPG